MSLHTLPTPTPHFSLLDPSTLHMDPAPDGREESALKVFNQIFKETAIGTLHSIFMFADYFSLLQSLFTKSIIKVPDLMV